VADYMLVCLYNVPRLLTLAIGALEADAYSTSIECMTPCPFCCVWLVTVQISGYGNLDDSIRTSTTLALTSDILKSNPGLQVSGKPGCSCCTGSCHSAKKLCIYMGAFMSFLMLRSHWITSWRGWQSWCSCRCVYDGCQLPHAA
jgi:hypothetical protein